MPPLPSVSFIIPCKGRLDHLQQTLPSVLAQDYAGEWEVVVIDYDCPQGTADWLESLHEPRIRVVRVRDNAAPFHMNHSRNVGGRAACGQILAFIDADNSPDPGYLTAGVTALRSSGADLCLPTTPEGGNFGCSLVAASRFHVLRGFDEAFVAYGMCDIDFYQRFRARGWITTQIPSALIAGIDHGDDDRMRFYPTQDKTASIAANIERSRDPQRSVNHNGYGRTSALTLVDYARALPTDKGTDHSYLEPYEWLLAPLRHTARNVLEIGCLRGGSLRLWADWFARAGITGLERQPLDLDIERVTVLRGDAYSPEILSHLRDTYDLIIDDGSHLMVSWRFVLEQYLPRLAPGGLLVIEDIYYDASLPELYAALPVEYRRHATVIDRRRVQGRADDRMLVIHRPRN